MEIHYLWIKNYGHLKNAGINLSSKFVITFDLANEIAPKKQPVLSIERNPDYIPNFFENEKVRNVTAIIGKNGSGKSSILNYIKTHLPEGVEATIDTDLFVYSKGEGQDETFYVIKPSDVYMKLENSTDVKFEIVEYGHNTDNDIRFNSDLGNAEFIYYSYFLDHQVDTTAWQGLKDISTTRLLLGERKRILDEYVSLPDASNSLLSRTSDLEYFRLDEVARAIQFFGSEDSKQLPFVRPEELQIEINLDDSHFFDNNKKHKDVEKLLGELYKLTPGNLPKENVLNNFLLALLINFLVDERIYGSNNPYRHKFELKPEDTLRSFIFRFFDELGNASINYQNRSVGIPRYQEISVFATEFYSFLESAIDHRNIKAKGVYELSLPLNDDTEVLFQRFRTLYLGVKGLGTFLNFRWRSLSTGEQSYLSLMSRFYHVKHHEHGDLNKNLFIMIDEGDACYHPEWQRKFFSKTLDFLSRLFHDRFMQIVLTANTPFLSSDLPKSNVLFIQRVGKDGQEAEEVGPENRISIYHSKDNDREETFAANIHTLLSNSFYMKGVLMGEFARKKIDQIIQFLRDSEQADPNENYKKTIDIIGEPVLRKKLQDMWAEKFGYEEELKVLQQRIDEINRLKQQGRQND